MADRVYIEPLLPDTVRKILEIEKPDALLAGMGGQTALTLPVNCPTMVRWRNSASN